MEDWDMEEFLDDLEPNTTDPAQDAGEGDEDLSDAVLYLAGSGYIVSGIQQLVRRFIGPGRLAYVPITEDFYYADLLAWALQRHLVQDGWQVRETLGMDDEPPRYERISTAPGRQESVLFSGIMLLTQRGIRLVVSIKPDLHRFQVMALSQQSAAVTARRFIRGVERVMKRDNFYRGHKIQFGSSLRFLKLSDRDWSDLTLAPGVKETIVSHTIDFLQRAKELEAYGIAPRRGLLLTGKPGTGKTLVCKVLMNHSPGISCIVAHASGLQYGTYIEDVYRIANDISPSIVVLEDIDLIGRDRQESHYLRGESLAQLLCQLDGVEECRNVITIATTNVLDILDEALKDRPSRFDRVVAFEPPGYEERLAYIDYLARRMPVPEPMRERLAKQSEGLTPAQIQEAVHSIVIEAHPAQHDAPDWEAVFSADAIDVAVSTVRRRGGQVASRAND